MARIPAHTIEDAPAVARPVLAEMAQFSSSGQLLNMHAQMAQAPAVPEAYVPIGRTTARQRTLDPPVRTALMLAAAAVGASRSALAITSMLALRSGWRPDQVQALLAGRDPGEDKLDALTGVVPEAVNCARVTGSARADAVGQGRGDEQLAEAFAYLGLTVFSSCFLNYAATSLDIPAGRARPGDGA